MTATTPSRRERLRAETVTEIKDAARRLLVAGGPTAISLRAIAREVGMTAPALYRYFASLDALVTTLVSDLFEDLRAAVADVSAVHADEDPLTRIGHMARGFRRWSLDHPAEFALMFGSPLPGVTPLPQRGPPLDEAGARFGETFFAVMSEHYARRSFAGEPHELPDPALREIFRPYIENFGDRFPPAVIYFFITSWTRLYGMVAMEVFGHLAWAVTDVAPLFEVELARALDQLAR
ncbi:TetR/AcrR family transcriptional regulator [Actinoplanes sp. NPDC051346]|uniref:TetR/AcrR family transcriptional regulator n=1 Tax=Actinoplanes sp. NPDC051346 TaxID=3155048 RepID=UPI003417A1EE